MNTSLTRRQRRVARLYYGHNMTHAEIAKRLNIARQTVTRHLTAARRREPNLPAPRAWNRMTFA